MGLDSVETFRLEETLKHLSEQNEQLRIEKQELSAHCSTHDVMIEKLNDENDELKDLLAAWIKYIDADETFMPPLSQTREALKKGE